MVGPTFAQRNTLVPTSKDHGEAAAEDVRAWNELKQLARIGGTEVCQQWIKDRRGRHMGSAVLAI